MEKFVIYFILIMMADLIFTVAGIETTPAALYTIMKNPENIGLTTFYKASTAALLGLAGGALALGAIFTKNWRLLLAGAATVLITFTIDLVIVFNELAAKNVYLAIFCVAPIMMLYILGLIDWVGK